MTVYFIESTLRVMPVLMLASLGGLLAERSGVATLCLEGLLLVGAFAAVLATHLTGSCILGIAFAILAGGLFAAIHAYLSINASVNQFVSGIIVNLTAASVTSFLLGAVFGVSGATEPVPSTIWKFSVPAGLVGIVILVGVMLGGFRFFRRVREREIRRVTISCAFQIIALVTTAIAMGIFLVFDFTHTLRISSITALACMLYGLGAWVLTHTWIGNWITACGESEVTAASSGIPVHRLRWICIVVCGGLCAIGGAYLSTGFVDVFREDLIGGRGFLSVAVVVFGLWRPGRAFLACILFSSLEGFQSHLQSYAWWPTQASHVLPYAVVLMSLFAHRGNGNVPSELGKIRPKEIKPLKLRLGIILATGSIKDRSINQYVCDHSETIARSTQALVSKTVFPAHSLIEIERTLKWLSKRHTHIVGLGAFMEKPFADFAKGRNGWPELAVIDGGLLPDSLFEDQDQNCLTSLTFDEAKLATPAGYLAAAMAARIAGQNAKVGFLGGVELPVVSRWADGFQTGVRIFNNIEGSAIGVELQFLGTSHSAFSDRFAGRHATTHLIEWKQVSVIMQACGAACLGVIEAAEDANRLGTKCLVISADYVEKRLGSPVAFGILRSIDTAITCWINRTNFEQAVEQAGVAGPAWNESVRRDLGSFQTFDKEWRDACKKTS